MEQQSRTSSREMHLPITSEEKSVISSTGVGSPGRSDQSEINILLLSCFIFADFYRLQPRASCNLFSSELQESNELAASLP